MYGEVGFVGLAADARTVLEVDTANVRETESARCSLNQARADALLELTDFATDGRLRHRKMPRRRCEAPGIGYSCKDDHRIQVLTLVVHHCPFFWDSHSRKCTLVLWVGQWQISLMTLMRWTVIGCVGSIFAPLLPRETYEEVYRDGPDVILAGSAPL